MAGVPAGLRAERPRGPSEPPFATRLGTPNTPNPVLKTIIAPTRERAYALLETRGELPIAHLTPHTLRRTFASLIAVCEVHPRRAMQLLGYTDAKFTRTERAEEEAPPLLADEALTD